MQFLATSEPLLFAAQSEDGTVSPSVLYLLPRSVTDPPATLSFEQTWTGTGCYLFLAAELAAGQDAAFAAAAWTYLADPRTDGVRFVWVQPFEAGLPLAGTWLGVYQPAGSQQWLTGHLVDFSLASVDILLPMNSVIGTGDSSFTFTPPAGQTVGVSAAWGGAPAGTVTGPVSVALTGAGAGALRFPIELTEADQTALDVGLRWYYAYPDGAGDQQFFLSSYRYPLLAQTVTLYAQLHPLAPLDGSRSYLAFTAADAGQTGPAPGALASYYLSTLGDPFTLSPLTGTAEFAALVLATSPRASQPGPGDPVTFIPRGQFGLASARTGAVQLMCGLSGVEYLELPAGDVQTMSFYPGQPAYAASFVPGGPPVTGPLPDSTPTTSFASIASTSATLGYYAQPDQSVLYNYPPGGSLPGSSVAGNAATMLSAVPVLAASLPLAAAVADVQSSQPICYPLLPYAGVGGTVAVAGVGQLEAQAVSPARRQVLRAFPPVATPMLAANASSYSTTPQGLLARGVGQASWSRVVLAQLSGDVSPARQLALTDVSEDLLASFQSNKMFLVASDPAALAPHLQSIDAQLFMGSDPTEQWQFNLDPQQWNAHGTIMLLKFYDQAISDLVRQPSMWSSPGTFNADPADISRQLQQIIQNIPADDPDFAALGEAVSNPSWNGILAFNVVAPLNELPAQLAGLAVGIDRSKFCAHHVGIAASKINAIAGADIGISDSSMFGLIDYVGPQALPGGQLLYQFSVEQLTVLFSNSDVASFSCIIKLQVNELFGEQATLAGSTDNVVRLYGSFDKHVSNGTVQESYSFQTKAGVPSDFAMTSQVLTTVELGRGQFATITSASSASLTEAQFVFWGLLDFQALAGFDALSFGREPGTLSPTGLSFGNLVISMTFDPADATPVPIFDFEAGQLSFDLAGSVARKDSFYQHFPLSLSAFTQAKDGTTPSTLNYLGVQTPLNQSALEYPWYSLDFDLNLGSAGALAAKASFVATLTVAWTPGGTSYSVFTGLKLPGSNSSKRAISIEGLFDITFKSLQVIAVADNVYVLVLYGIAFSFLSFSFPPSGQVDFALFGDPRVANGGSSLGWYASYARPNATPPAQKQLATNQRALPAGPA